MWFTKLMGFNEESAQQVRANILLDKNTLHSLVNGNTFIFGQLETPSLGELKQRVSALNIEHAKTSIREQIASAQSLHADTDNTNALFQVASQFNLLEMISPAATPEQGVDGYESDYTQGPACAVAAGAGTIYRNYFAPVNGKPGQTTENQIDCLADIGFLLDNTDNQLWNMTNGYALACEKGLVDITAKLDAASESQLKEIQHALKIGLQWNTQVTISESTHNVSQAYCSALPVAYSQQPSDLWEKFAQLILNASYEACLCAGILNYHHTGNNKIYLTLIGGGAFGNETDWIMQAIHRALDIYKHTGLDIIIVSHNQPNPAVQKLIRDFSV
ncbi:hypothetical protein MNBD_GAMMA11-1934 [hydrothermal vent metagenome]|uniref:Uncharacterized protein n=1 Tax=hydrothermal vent metagenome TaxID=652676 RepID=A0A3B0XAD8_9ZZZZ